MIATIYYDSPFPWHYRRDNPLSLLQELPDGTTHIIFTNSYRQTEPWPIEVIQDHARQQIKELIQCQLHLHDLIALVAPDAMAIAEDGALMVFSPDSKQSIALINHRWWKHNQYGCPVKIFYPLKDGGWTIGSEFQ